MRRALPLRVVGGAAPGLGEGPTEVPRPAREHRHGGGSPNGRRPQLASSWRVNPAGPPRESSRKQSNKKGEQLEPFGVRHPWN
ncbi:hypothetical protein O1L55_11985 [Streptomyces albulus]|nr:hypothetical protein [Streptomyces noursei]